LIERDTKMYLSNILERLNKAERKKLDVLEKDMNVIKDDIQKINDIIIDFNNLAESDVKPIEYLLRSKILNENIKHSATKPFRTEINVIPYDLPQEIKKHHEELEKLL